MLDGKRKLRYIPLFYNDLENAADYIANTIGNVQAAIELLDKVEVAILNRLPIADAFEPYPSRKERKQDYYKIYVGNYVIYYVVLEEDGESVMEVRRFLYRGRNREVLI
ncbi:MAG: type II toxin-antitoxin system RelE/ParE family toxin [Selenomonas ruminantium]|jgi:plasmid stabilization system protein ParE|uniref:Type II toxin-antitoxin system RelE/ParE family toxin n=1 Tax=Selenomonas ruminantium TaxID=971 RepID=A0A927WLM4_SELRU|nr:type II toxin-antitoxin system RelE/ParE family toxin [Selenomonas ruminantium]